MKEKMRKRMEEMDQELQEEIEGEVLQLNLNVIQARMLLCIHRAGCMAMTDEGCDNPGVKVEALMFRMTGTAYPKQSLKLREALKAYDAMVEEKIAAIALGTVREQLTEMLGKDAADALLGEEDDD